MIAPNQMTVAIKLRTCVLLIQPSLLLLLIQRPRKPSPRPKRHSGADAMPWKKTTCTCNVLHFDRPRYAPRGTIPTSGPDRTKSIARMRKIVCLWAMSVRWTIERARVRIGPR